MQITLCSFAFSHYIIAMNRSLMLFLAGMASIGYGAVLADIDYVDTRVEWDGTPSLRLGDRLSYRNFSLGGFVEVGNEKRFHQEYLPNHNWRGVMRFAHEQVFVQGNWGSITLPLAFQHESAHGSMGVQEPTQSAFESIYDGRYRNVNRNGFSAGALYQFKGPVFLTFQGNYIRYLRSRNTPEAADTHLTDGHAMSYGAELRLPLGSRKITACASTYFRQEFESSEHRVSTVYFDSPDGVVSRDLNYAPLQMTRTIAALLGLRVVTSSRPVLVYAGWTFGNQGGFVDSREETHRIAMGIAFGN